MKRLLTLFCHDEAGFVVSSELVLIVTIAVLALVVGLSELAFSINQELEDVGTAFGTVNQSYIYNGMEGHHALTAGSLNRDDRDFCDDEADLVGAPAVSEGTQLNLNNNN
ncbi:MAG: branched-chain amino acid aminotransferase [Planctomycetaceae bacterium]|nr:branched-chain amino acid aminotransferase [Planctomycetaceae bacterium]